MAEFAVTILSTSIAEIVRRRIEASSPGVDPRPPPTRAPTRANSFNKLIDFFSGLDGDVAATKKAISELDSFIRQYPIIGIAECVKGGSFGRGTFLGPHTDVDLVYFVQAEQAAWHVKVHAILLGLQQLLSAHDQVVASTVTRFSVNALYCVQPNSPDSSPVVVNFDLLVAPASLRHCTAAELRAAMEEPAELPRYLHCASVKLQKQYARKIFADAGLTALIRLMKRWVLLQRLKTAPCSYCLELVMAHCFNLARDAGEKDKDAVIKSFIALCAEPENIYVNMANHVEAADDATKPVVVDLVIPSLNVAFRQDSNENVWKHLRRRARGMTEAPDVAGAFRADLTRTDDAVEE